MRSMSAAQESRQHRNTDNEGREQHTTTVPDTVLLLLYVRRMQLLRARRLSQTGSGLGAGESVLSDNAGGRAGCEQRLAAGGRYRRLLAMLYACVHLSSVCVTKAFKFTTRHADTLLTMPLATLELHSSYYHWCRCTAVGATGSCRRSAETTYLDLYTVSGKKEATLFSTTTLAFFGRFL